MKIVCFATGGTGGFEEQRITSLLSSQDFHLIPYSRQSRQKNFLHILKRLKAEKPDLVVMEGTGAPGGLALIFARLFLGTRYVFSSGDAVGPILSIHFPPFRFLFWIYERLLCGLCDGFIGWTPYLVGRALTMGAPRAITIPGSLDNANVTHGARERLRAKLGVPADAIVYGIVGSQQWVRKTNYCYGLELIQAKLLCGRADAVAVIIGDGTGRERLLKLAGTRLGKDIFIPGRCQLSEIYDYLSVFDVAILPQSVDKVGSFRYTTKFNNYLSARLPTVLNQIPASYDLDDGWIIRLKGASPWDPVYIRDLARTMSVLTREDILVLKENVPTKMREFDKDRQIEVMGRFIEDILSNRNMVVN